MSSLRTPTAPALDIGRCFNDAVAAYKKNFLALFLAAIIFDFLAALTLLVLAGPLLGGICLMTLKSLRREDKALELGDLFGAFGRFGTLVGLFFLTGLLSLAGSTVRPAWLAHLPRKPAPPRLLPAKRTPSTPTAGMARSGTGFHATVTVTSPGSYETVSW
jgi:hypothetical protein